MKDALKTVAEAIAVFLFVSGLGAASIAATDSDAPAPRYAEAGR